MGIDGRIFPVGATPTKPATRKGETSAFEEFLDHWYPIQVKQKDKVGRPDIDADNDVDLADFAEFQRIFAG